MPELDSELIGKAQTVDRTIMELSGGPIEHQMILESLIIWHAMRAEASGLSAFFIIDAIAKHAKQYMGGMMDGGHRK